MTKNSFKNIKEKDNSENKFSKTFYSLIDGSFLTRDGIIKMLPFFFYLMGLALFLIFNSYYAEKKAREKEELRGEIIELRIEYINTKSELMSITNQSVVARRLAERGLSESSVPPIRIEKPKEKRSFLSTIFGWEDN